MPKEITHEGTLANGHPFSLLGRAHNGEAEQIDEDIFLAGQDALFVLPEHNVAGVFDGAGGATDIGSPALAAITAARAVRDIIKRRGDGVSVGEAMESARHAVVTHPEAGICVGGFVRMKRNTLEIANAGDTGVAVYHSHNETLEMPGEQQTNSINPLNSLGRQERGIRNEVDDLVTTKSISPVHDQVYILSDGVLGNWRLGTELQEYHFQAAHADYLRLATAERHIPHLEEKLREQLSTEAARVLKERQLRENDVCSPELDNPAMFSIKQFDWALWEEIVKPYIDRHLTAPVIVGAHAVNAALATRQIAWQFERLREDDASIIRIAPPDTKTT